MRLEEELDTRLDQEARRESLSRSELARQALADYLVSQEWQRFHDEIGRAVERIPLSEAIAIAEDALALDNEALELTEPRAAYRVCRRTTKRGR